MDPEADLRLQTFTHCTRFEINVFFKKVSLITLENFTYNNLYCFIKKIKLTVPTSRKKKLYL
jgi:hypothetical protein